MEIGDLIETDYGRDVRVWDGRRWISVSEANRKLKKVLGDKPKLLVKDLMDDLQEGVMIDEVMKVNIKEGVNESTREQSHLMITGTMSAMPMGIGTASMRIAGLVKPKDSYEDFVKVRENLKGGIDYEGLKKT